jgi:uncharacterized phage protein (TIGR01671 family)
MREIKFRFWNKKRELMSKVYGLGTLWECLNGEWGVWEWRWEDVIKLQYTGLKDKNGKEIYEGDIVEGFGGEKYKVIWEDNWSRFVFENFDEEDYSYDPADNENCSQHYLEVIGNIYENSDLLSDDKKGENK